MKRTPLIVAAAGAAALLAPAVASAHTFDATVSCILPSPATGPNAVAAFSYSANAAGTQSASESITVGGAVAVPPTLRTWTIPANAPTQTFPRTFTVPTTGPVSVVAATSFVGSDGFRYARSVTRTVSCPPRPTPPPPTTPPVVTPPPPTTPPVVTPPPVTPPPPTPPRVLTCEDYTRAAVRGGSERVRRAARAKLRALGCTVTSSRRVGKPTVCRTFPRRPRNGFVGAGFPRPGQVRVRFDAARGVWTTAKGDRWTITTRSDGTRSVTFTPGEFDRCMSIVPPVTG